MEQRYNALSSLLLAEDSKRQRTDHMARETGVLQRDGWEGVHVRTIAVLVCVHVRMRICMCVLVCMNACMCVCCAAVH